MATANAKMFQSHIIHCIVLLLGQLMFTTAEESPSPTDVPEMMTVVIKNHHQTITLNWKRSERSVANENLPIWIARRNREPELAANLMEDIGPLTFYHDVEKSSAVVLFHRQQRIYGLVDTRFLISALPLSQVGINIHHTVGGRHVIIREDGAFHDEFHDFPDITADEMINVNSISAESPSLLNSNEYTNYLIDIPQAGPSNEQQFSHNPHEVGDILYGEVLVFVSHNVVRHFTSDNSDLHTLVAYYLIHFNAIDMLYAKLPNDIQIHINIAGLVLEMRSMIFPYVFLSSVDRPLRVLDGQSTLIHFQGYIKKHDNIFVRDSFDFFYISTHYEIDCRGQSIFGISVTADNYANRKNEEAEYKVSGVLVERRPVHSDFVTSAHELAHQMHVEHDPTTSGIYCGGEQCFAILHEAGSYCKNCIRWSDQSINEFKQFARSNLDHCFLLNEPRSLHPFGTPLKTIGPNQQCICYGYQSHWTAQDDLDQVDPNNCNAKLECAYDNQPTSFATPKPIDGTPCGMNEICWRERCELLESSPFMQLLNDS